MGAISMTPKQHITLIAAKARKWAEVYAYETAKYNGLVELANSFAYELGGFCAIASAKLFEMLRAEGFDAWLAYHKNHVFVVVILSNKKKYLVDVTATQFRKKPIEVRLYPQASSKLEFWKAEKLFRNVKDLKQKQLETNWPEEQLI